MKAQNNWPNNYIELRLLLILWLNMNHSTLKFNVNYDQHSATALVCKIPLFERLLKTV